MFLLLPRRLLILAFCRNIITDCGSLALFNHEMTDLLPLSTLVNLATLSLFGNQVADLQPLAK